MLGMASDAVDSNSISLIDRPGVAGELVCRQPFPSTPLGFWNDTNNEKYLAAYFEGFPGVWTHGDFASKSATGGASLAKEINKLLGGAK